MLGRITKIGKVKTRYIVISVHRDNYEKEFERQTQWINEDTEVLAMIPININTQGYWVEETYKVIYRKVDRELI